MMRNLITTILFVFISLIGVAQTYSVKAGQTAIYNSGSTGVTTIEKKYTVAGEIAYRNYVAIVDTIMAVTSTTSLDTLSSFTRPSGKILGIRLPDSAKYKEAITVADDSIVYYTKMTSGNNAIIEGADVITGLTEYSNSIYEKTGVTTQPFVMYLDGVVGVLRTSIAECVNYRDWYWASDVLYINIAEITGSDLLDGWEFTSGWDILATATIDDSDSFTPTARYGSIAQSTVAGFALRLYKLHVSGNTVSDDLRLMNRSDNAIYITGMGGAFDETVYIKPALQFAPRFRDYSASFGTANIDSLTFQECTINTTAIIELGQRGELVSIGGHSNITLKNLTIQHSNTGDYGSAIKAIGGDYLTIDGCTVQKNSFYGVLFQDNSHVKINNSIISRCGEGEDNVPVNVRVWSKLEPVTGFIFSNNICEHAGEYGLLTRTDNGGGDRFSNISIFGNSFNHNKGTGLYLQRSDSVVVYDNTFDGNGDLAHIGEDYAIGIQSCSNTDIYENTITNQLNNDAIQLYSDESIDDGNADNIRVFRNKIDGVINGDGIGIAFLGDNTAKNCQIFSNVIKGAELFGISMYHTGAGVESSVSIFNNTIVENIKDGVYLGADCPADIINNIFYQNGNFEINNQFGATLTTSNNLYYRASGNVLNNSGTMYDMSTIINYEATAQAADPLFMTEFTDLQLQAGSPAINNGVDVGLTEDILGNPIVGLPDIGAYEKQ